MLIVISGLPGTGKTTLAAALARRTRSVHLSVDAVEEALLVAGVDRGRSSGVAAYEAVRAAAEQSLVLGLTVIVDAVNDSEAARQTWRDAARKSGAELRFVVLQPPAPVEHRRRLRARTRALRHVAEPTWQQVVERAQTYEPWAEPHVRLATDASVATLVERLQQELPLTPEA